jgi:hypothetical protein
MSPNLLRVLRNHEYWRKAWSVNYPEYRRTTAMRMVHESSPGYRKQKGYERMGMRNRSVTYDTLHILRNDPEAVIRH